MQISSFKYFLAVAETGSVRLAALRLHVSASAISRQIQNLEHDFKSDLFERRASGMVLTREGEIVEQHMRRTMREMELAQAQIDDLHGLIEGEISYAAIEGVATSWLFPRIAAFQKEHPGVRFCGRIASSNDVCQALTADQADFGVTLLDALHGGVEIIQKYETKFKVAMSPEHPLSEHSSLCLKDLASYPLAVLTDQFQTRQLLNAAFAKRGLKFNIAFELDHIELLKRFVLSSSGITVLPDYALQDEVNRGTFSVANIPLCEIPSSTTVLCIRKGRRLTKASKIFIKSLCEKDCYE